MDVFVCMAFRNPRRTRCYRYLGKGYHQNAPTETSKSKNRENLPCERSHLYQSSSTYRNQQKLRNVGNHLLSNCSTNGSRSGLNPSRTLRNLKLTASRVDLCCLDYIRNELPALEKLVFKCHRLTGEIPKSTTIQELFERFNFYCNRFRSVVVDLKYEDVSLEFNWETEDFNTEESDTDDEVDEDGPKSRWRRN